MEGQESMYFDPREHGIHQSWRLYSGFGSMLLCESVVPENEHPYDTDQRLALVLVILFAVMWS